MSEGRVQFSIRQNKKHASASTKEKKSVGNIRVNFMLVYNLVIWKSSPSRVRAVAAERKVS